MVSATIISVVVVYLFLLIVIGFWGNKGSGDMAGYYVAGKKLLVYVWHLGS